MTESRVHNRLAEFRRKRGYSASQLAARAGVGRQTVYAMEAGTYVPNTAVALRLARTLETTVEELFRLKEEPAPPRAAEVQLLPGESHALPGRPLQVCRVRNRQVGVLSPPVVYQVPPADGLLEEIRPHRRAVMRPFQEEASTGERLLVAGCDPAASVLARHLLRASVEVVPVQRNSSQALRLLRDGWVHAAGSHLPGDHLKAVRKLFPEGGALVVSFAVWEEGLVVARGNPKGIRGIADLARRDVSLVNREPGAGSRMLLDRGLRAEGITPAHVAGYDEIAFGHLPAAALVLAGKGDCCVATRVAARLFGLDFLPLVRERYDLVLRRAHLHLPAIELLLETLNRAAFRRELEAMGGYDTSSTGQIFRA